MKISKKKHLIDQEYASPKQLFDTLTSMTRNISPHSRIQQFQNIIKKNRTCIGDDGELRQENSDFDQARNKKMHGLKKIIRQQKIKSIVRQFITKLKRNNPNSKPIIYQPFLNQEKRFIQSEGFQIPQTIDSILSIIDILQVAVLTFVFTLSLVFGDILKSTFGVFFLNFSIIFYTIEFILNLVTIKSMEGRKITMILQIIERYAKDKMIPDAVSILILIIDISTNWNEMIFLRMILLLKIITCLDKLQRIQNRILDNFSKEQYWGLIKVFLFNFIFAHFLAICLIAMSKLDFEKNWINNKEQLQNNHWSEIYIWAFYWATTIMLTVGFGDFSATNYKQALCLVIIQTISCIVLAYNINCVGILINNIRSQDNEKNKNFKIFKKLSEKNDIPQQLSWRINNYIEESSNIKKNFNFSDENQFISKLPISLKADFLKQSNKKIFQNLIFFRNLTEKTLLNFAEKIQMKICHPEEYVKRKQDENDLMILKQGHLGYFCRRNNSDFYNTLIDELKVQKQDPLLLSLDFISKDKTVYEMKSLQYSILFHLNYNTTINLLRSGQLDYQHYCQLRDKSRHIVDEYEIFNCDICAGHHTKFTCPKLHYVPMQQHIIIKHLYHIKHQKSTRLNFQRKKVPYSVLRMQKIDKNTNNIKCLTQQQSMQKLRRTGKFLPGTFPSQALQPIQLKNFQTQQLPINNKVLTDIKNYVDFVKKDIVIALQPHYEQQLWIIQSDMVHNFKFYFNQSNSTNLQHIRLKKT